MLTVQHLSITHIRDQRPLIRDLSFTLSGAERLAVIGEEGNGKSALLKAVCCPDTLSGWAQVSGSAVFTRERPGYLAQETPAAWADQPVYSLCLNEPGFQETEPSELAEFCRLLSLPSDFCWQDTAFGLLSGGEKVKLRLLLLLCGRPTMLFLDEPGNDLDLDALQALERFLLSCGLPVLYVSHDEALLTQTATQVLHLESLHGRREPRWTWTREPYADYVRNRRERLDRQESLWQQDRRRQQEQQERLRRIEDAVAHAQASISRRDPHGGRLLKKKMKAVKSLEHRFEREQADGIEKPVEEEAMNAFFSDITPIPAGRGVLDLRLPRLTAGERTLAENVTLQLRGSEKVLITGANGCGKTTLMRLIRERLEADGRFRVALMPQRYEELLDENRTPVEFLSPEGSKEQITAARSALITMKFARDELEHPIRYLSGGQKAKVLLRRLVMQKPEILLMDEPTRNLSPLSAPVMREMIRSFPGAVIAVTHDRLLIGDWPGRVLRLTPEGLKPAEDLV